MLIVSDVAENVAMLQQRIVNENDSDLQKRRLYLFCY
jgi:hypothetical protein